MCFACWTLAIQCWIIVLILLSVTLCKPLFFKAEVLKLKNRNLELETDVNTHKKNESTVKASLDEVKWIC